MRTKFYLLTALISLFFVKAFSTGTTTQLINFTAIANKTTTSADFALSATAESGLTVSFAVTTGGTIATVTGSTVHLTGIAGTVTITATQAGDMNFAAATPVSKTFTVTKSTQTISFATIAPKYMNSADFTLAATATSALTVAYAISGPATLSGSTVHITGTGTVSITASQAGNATYNAATSVVRSFTVTKASQTITFATIANKLINAADFTLAATASSGLAVSYAVTGPATITGSAVHLTGVAGTVVITASQAGNTIYDGATSIARSFTVSNLGTQTITFASIPTKYVNTADFTLAATATSGLAVTYSITGPATLSGSTVHLTGTAGTVSITAAQSGNSSYSAATSVVQSFTVSKLEQTITFAALTNKTVTDADFSITAATASSGLTTTYSISGPASLSGTTVHITGVGTVTITAAQAGNSSYNAATSVARSFIVEKASQTITFATIANKLVNAADFTLAATSSAGLTVTYAITGPATLTGSTVHLTGVTGTVSITASQAGNASYNAATNIVRSFTVGNLSAQTITFGTLVNKFVNSADFALTATASSGLAVTYSITGPATLSGSTIHLTGTVGTVTVTAAQAGNTSYTAATSVVRTFTVGKVEQTITFATLGNRLINAADFTLAATASSGLTVSYAITGPATLTGTTVHLTGVAGTVSITASQAGNSTYAAATNVVRSFVVSNLTAQTITFATIPAKSVTDADFTITPTASSGLTVTYVVTSGPATISGSTVHITGDGTVVITASQAGNTTYAAAPDVVRSFVVSKVAQTITWTAIASMYNTAADFTVSATASSGLTVTYSVVSGPATISGSTVHLTGVIGNVTLRATQAGTATYATKTADYLFHVTDDPAVRMMNPTVEETAGFYPNPSVNTIHLMNLTEDTKISVIDQQGNVKVFENVSAAEALNKSIDLSSLNKGMYYVRMESGKKSTQKILIKE